MANLVVLVVVILGLINGGYCQETAQEAPWRIHTLFSVECQDYFDWQTVGLVHSFNKARQPGPITRLLSCTDEEKKIYKGMDLAPTLEVPSMSRHPKTGDWYPAINKPAGVVHWLKHSKDAQNVDWVVILDADMIMRGPIIPWEIGAEKGRPVAAYYGYLIGCDNILAQLHTKHPELCDKVGGLLAMHIDDLRALAPMWLSKTEEVRADRAHWAKNITGDIYEKGWISEMYGYSFGAAEVGLRHKINDNLMIYPSYIPRDGVEPILMHYGLPFSVGNWSFSKLSHHEDSIVYDCGRLFPEPPYPREGNPMHALGESISFGRFMTESLSWEKWSSFSHNRYVEEASRYAQPGSVAQKKAFFEAHYKRIAAAKKAAALLEQANAANNADSEPEFQDQACNSTTHDSQCTMTNSQVPFDEQLEVKNTRAEVDSIVNVNGCNSWAEMEIGMVEAADSVAENEALVENPVKNRSLNQIENVVNQTTMVSEMGFGESPLMEKKPLLEGFKSGQEAPSPVSKKKPPFSSSKSSVHRRAPKVSATPAKPTAYIHPIKENDVTPITRKSPIHSMDKRRPTSKCLHTLIYSTPAKEPDKSTTSAARKTESSRVAHSSYKPSKDFKTPLTTPTMAYLNGVLKNPSATPCSENKRPRTPKGPSASESKTTGPKWQILSTGCTKSLSACRNKLQSPTTSAPFSLRTEERAARRKQKLEEKFNAKEAEKVHLQTRLKDKAETEMRKLRQNLCFKARPLPEFYKGRETPKNQIKKKTPLTRPQSPKLGRKSSSSTLQGLTSQPPVIHSTKNSGPKNVLKQRSRIPNRLTSLPEMMITHENTSPNIQH